MAACNCIDYRCAHVGRCLMQQPLLVGEVYVSPAAKTYWNFNEVNQPLEDRVNQLEKRIEKLECLALGGEEIE